MKARSPTFRTLELMATRRTARLAWAAALALLCGCSSEAVVQGVLLFSTNPKITVEHDAELEPHLSFRDNGRLNRDHRVVLQVSEARSRLVCRIGPRGFGSKFSGHAGIPVHSDRRTTC